MRIMDSRTQAANRYGAFRVRSDGIDLDPS